jgi:hypothetical protein
MKKFLILYKAPLDAMAQTTNMTPEQQAKGMEAWMHWAKKCGDRLIDMGIWMESLHYLGDILTPVVGMQTRSLKSMNRCHCQVCDLLFLIF